MARHVAMIAGAGVAGAIEAAHSLAWGGRIAPWPIAFMVIGTFVELEMLTAIFDRGLARRRSFAGSSAFAIAIGIAGSFLAWALQWATGLPIVAGPLVTPAIVAQLGAFNGLVALGLWATAVAVPLAVEAEQLRTETELTRLRASLQPHFLLNTLSTIAGLVTEDPREARKLIGALGDLMRDSLEDGEDMQSLADEIAWLKRYADILETRHRGNLTFHWDVAVAAGGARIPRLLLQPLLENAVTHGALRRTDGEISVRAAIVDDRVTCVIEDNGPGPDARGPRAGARGLELVTRRLALRYAGDAAFRIERGEGHTRSIVELPAEAS